jgi:hypothetical protein
MPSTAFLTIACAVWFAACASTPAVSTIVPFSASSAVSGASGGSNHGVWKSNSATTRMNRRSEQYTHGRLRKYVADMKRTRYTGEAWVRRLQACQHDAMVFQHGRRHTGRKVRVSSFLNRTLFFVVGWFGASRAQLRKLRSRRVEGRSSRKSHNQEGSEQRSERIVLIRVYAEQVKVVTG